MDSGRNEAARLRVRGRPGERRRRADEAVQDAGPVPARGGRGRSRHRRRLHDRGRRPDGFYRFVPDTSGDLRHGDAADAAGQGPAAVQHHHRPDRRRGARVQLGHDRRPRPGQRRGRRLGRVQAGSREGRREVPGRRGLHVPRRLASCSARATAATPGSGRSGSTRRPTTSASSTSRASSSCCTSRPSATVLDGPDNLTHEPRRRDRDRRGRQPEEQLRPRRCCPTARSINVAENLVAVQQHYLEASGKLYDPTVPDDGASAGDGVGFSEFAGPRFSPDGTVAVREHPGAGHHVRDHGRLGEPGPVTDGRGADRRGSDERSAVVATRRGRRRATSSNASPRCCTADWPTRSGRS